MKIVCAVLWVVLLLSVAIAAQAVVMDTVRVGEAGNAADTTGYGSVGYAYNIGKFEVTTAQYTEFLNAKAQTDLFGLYNTYMANLSLQGCNIQRTGTSGSYVYTVGTGSTQDIADWGNRPVNYVSYWDASRFINWLNNGQGNGDTETGAYTLNNYNDNDGRTIQRNAGWKWAIASGDEWYKAAYYKGGSLNAGYWKHATQSDTAPTNQVLGIDPGNSANYRCNDTWSVGYPYFRSNVGEFENSASAYGTFDQAGNVREWTESMTVAPDVAFRGMRGGGWASSNGLQASYDGYFNVNMEHAASGFRIVQAVPEPSCLIVLSGGLLALVGMRRRRA